MEFDENLLSAGRLAILAALVPGAPLSFTHLKRATGLADGNLHVQSKKLEKAGYVEAIRGARGKRPITHFKITEEGIAAMKLHIRKLQRIMASESGVIGPRRPGGRREESQVWCP